MGKKFNYNKYIKQVIEEADKEGVEYKECEENLDLCGTVPDGYDYAKALENYKVSTREQLYQLAEDRNFDWNHVRALDEVVQKWDRKKKHTGQGKGLLAQYVELVRKIKESGIDPRELDGLF